MALSRRSSRTGRSRFTLLLLVLTSITVLTLDFRGSGAVDDLRGGAATVFGPLRDAGAWAGRPFSDAWNGVFGYDDLEAENQRLRDELDRMRSADARAEAVLQEQAELDELHDLTSFTDLPAVTARVTGSGLTNFEHTFEIDKGSDHGLAEGNPVVTGAGLVGRLIQVTSTRSVVQVISDPAWSWGARLARSLVPGVIRGTGEGEPLVIDEGVPADTDVNRNEVVTTSGFATGIFPPGIPVGRVSEITTAPDELQHTLRVVPLADLDSLVFVSVLQWVPTP
jgi:rod shape-determining protein MreC